MQQKHGWRTIISKSGVWAIAWIIPTILIVAWEMAVRAHWIAPSQAAAPSEVVARLFHLVASGVLVRHALFSLLRLLVGVLLGVLLGVFSAVALTNSRTADRLVSPTIQFLAGVPVIVWMPFWVMFFGTGEAFKVAMASVTAFFVVQAHAVHTIRLVQRDYLELAAIYEKSKWATMLEIMLPAALPTILTAVRVTLALGWVVIFFVEYASATQGQEGLGWFISDARGTGKVEDEFAGLLLLALIAFLLDKVLAFVQRHLSVWSNSIESVIAQEGV